MQKQFELIEKLYDSSKASEERIALLRNEIKKEFQNIRTSLIDVYDHEADVLFLVQFDSYGLTFFKATKDKLHELILTWFDSKKTVIVPKTFIDAVKLLQDYNSPTNCEIRSYQTFGFFDDIHKRWDRIDWISEQTLEKKFLFEVSETEWLKGIKTTAEFYGL